MMLCGGFLAVYAEPTDAAAEQQVAIPTAQPVTHAFSRDIAWFGRVVATQSVTLNAQVAGRVVAIGAADGARVQQGDLLFTLRGEAITAQRHGLQVRFESAKKGLKLAQKSRDIRRSMLNERLSNRELFNRTQQAVEQATTKLATAKEALAILDAAIDIRAPIGGIFTARTVNIGQRVVAGSSLGRVIDPDQLRIEASVFPPVGVQLQGLTAQLRGASSVWQPYGSVQRVFPDRNSAGAVRIWIVGESVAGLHPGASVSGRLVGATHSALAVPVSAIARNEQGVPFLFVQSGQGMHKRAIRIGLVDQGWVEVLSGLDGSERVATQGVYELLYGNFSSLYREPD